MNTELNKVNEWFLYNKLVLNIQKTKFMIFGKKNIDKQSVQIFINDVELERVETVKFLGIYIDDNMKWKSQIDKLCNQVSRNIGVINRLSEFIPQMILLTLYNTLILCHLNYGISIWGSSDNYLLNRILILQKRCVRIISKSGFRAHTAPLFNKFKILPVHALYDYNVGIFMYLYFNDLLPSNFDSLFDRNIDIHSYNTRGKLNYRVNYGQSSLSRSLISYNGPLLWNSLPEYIKSSKSLNIFKYKFKEYIFNNL